MNPFKPNDIVKINSSSTSYREGGVVLYIACYGATNGGGKICDRKNCSHTDKDYVWVLWEGLKNCFSYKYDELSLMERKHDTIEKVKEVFDNMDKVEPLKMSPEFWKAYNGFTKIKTDRYGRQFIHETIEERPYIQENELDFSVYNGFKEGSVKKLNE